MRVTLHFAAEEFACRDGTPYPAEWIEPRLRPLCDVLEAIRTAVGGPLVLLSGYRTAAYNRRIGGARRSQHVEGRAADLRPPPGWTATRLHGFILGLYHGGELELLGGLGRYPRFVHVDTRPTDRLAQWTGSRVVT